MHISLIPTATCHTAQCRQTEASHRGVEIETAPSRLGLARVSVVRGEGPQAGKACIDDYIRATEPVYDYLTQYSGLRNGDLDPAMSQHHLTTLKASYLKLRFLADAGCIFVGHGLKKDFRMINMLVPPEQVEAFLKFTGACGCQDLRHILHH